ncbi:vitellogenin-1-like [Hyperolius riggenbachi]|uniref:vitellogenin-1-like n=1 Tax=Hyperolius riggenbachi TaxID=752182 RepID=UPI0035A301C7
MASSSNLLSPSGIATGNEATRGTQNGARRTPGNLTAYIGLEEAPGLDFPSSKRFTFTYDGQVLTGLTENDFAKSGIRVKCLVQISAATPRLLFLKIHELQIEEFNGIWPDDEFTSSDKLTKALEKQLVEPIKFEYNQGQVGELHLPRGVTETAANLLRGIVNILQVTIKKNQNAYIMQENGIAGLCNSNYIIQEHQSTNQLHIMKSVNLNECEDPARLVTGNAYLYTCHKCLQRNKNFRAAATYNYDVKATKNGGRLLKAEVHEVHQFTPFNEIDGAVMVEARQKLVLAAVQEQLHSTPENNDYITKESLRYHFERKLIQTPIQLLRTKNAENQISDLLHQLVEHTMEPLSKASPHKFLEMVHHLRMVSYEQIESLWKQFSAKIHHRKTNDDRMDQCGLNDKATYLASKFLVGCMTMGVVGEWLEVCQGACLKVSLFLIVSQKVGRRWILDALPAIGHHFSLQFLRLKLKDLSEFEAAQAVPLALHLIKADREAIAEAKSLLAAVDSHGGFLLRKVTYLAYGSLVHKFCIMEESCPKEALEPLHDLLMDAAKTRHEEDLILALKALANSGQVANIKHILKFLPGFSSGASHYPLSVKTAALLALKNIALTQPAQVMDICLQLYMDLERHPLLRMTAAAIILDNKPSSAVIMTIAKSLMKEADVKVGSFVYSVMKRFSKSVSPDLHEVAAVCNMAVTFLKAKYEDTRNQFSSGIYYDTFADSLMSGLESLFMIIHNPSGDAIPVGILGILKTRFMGVFTELLKIGYRAEGLQELLMNQEFPGSASSHSIKKSMEMLKKLHGWKPLPSTEPLITAYIKMFGQELFYHEINKYSIENILKILQGGKFASLYAAAVELQKGLDISWSKPLVSSENRLIVPTCVGLPLETSLSYSSVTRVQLKAQANISPEPKDDMSILHLLSADINLKTKVALSMTKDIVFVTGINTNMVQAGMEFRTQISLRLPADAEATFNIGQKYVKVDYVPDQLDTEIFGIRSKAYAVTRNTEDSAAEKMTPIVPAGTEANILKTRIKDASEGDIPQAKDKFSAEVLNIGDNYWLEQPRRRPQLSDISTCAQFSDVGLQLCLEKKCLTAAFVRNSPLYRIIGDHFLSVTLKPAHAGAPVEKIQMEFQAGPGASMKMVRSVNVQRTDDGKQKLESPVDRTALTKLQRILGLAEVKNQTDSQNITQTWSSENFSIPGNTEPQPEGNKEQQPEGNTKQQAEGNTKQQPEGNTKQQPEGNTKQQPEENKEQQPEGTKQINKETQKEKSHNTHHSHHSKNSTRGHEQNQSQSEQDEREIKSHTHDDKTHHKHKHGQQSEDKKHPHPDHNHKGGHKGHHHDGDDEHKHGHKETHTHTDQHHSKEHKDRDKKKDKGQKHRHHQQSGKGPHSHTDQHHSKEQKDHDKKKEKEHKHRHHQQSGKGPHSPTDQHHPREPKEKDNKHKHGPHQKSDEETPFNIGQHQSGDGKGKKKEVEIHCRCWPESKEHHNHSHGTFEEKHQPEDQHQKEHDRHHKGESERRKHQRQGPHEAKHKHEHEREGHREKQDDRQKTHNRRGEKDDLLDDSSEWEESIHPKQAHQKEENRPCTCPQKSEEDHKARHHQKEKHDQQKTTSDHKQEDRKCTFLSSESTERTENKKNYQNSHQIKQRESTDIDTSEDGSISERKHRYKYTESNSRHQEWRGQSHDSSQKKYDGPSTKSRKTFWPTKKYSYTSDSESSNYKAFLEPEVVNAVFKSTSTVLAPKQDEKSSEQDLAPYNENLSRQLFPSAVLLVKTFFSDAQHRGYQATAYLDRYHAKVAIVSLAPNSSWKTCLNASLSKFHKASAAIRWGNNCEDYSIAMDAATGQLAENPAVQLYWQWKGLPSWLKRAAGSIMDFVPGVAYMLGFSELSHHNTPRRVTARVAVRSEDAFDTIIKTPEMTIYKQGIPIPMDLSFGRLQRWIRHTDFTTLPELTTLAQNYKKAICRVGTENIVTFDQRSLGCSLSPAHCYTVIAQDCTNELKFLVAMKKMGQGLATFELNVRLGSSDIKIHSDASEEFHIRMNGMWLLLQNNTYINEKDCIRIHKNATTVTVKAPKNELEQIAFDGQSVQIQVSPRIRGRTCGLCGNADYCPKNDFQKPNHETAKSCNGLAHSWTVPENMCLAGCAMSHKYIMLEDQLIGEQPSTCYSTEPVLTCMIGCLPAATTPVTLAFHCLRKDSAITLADWQANPRGSSEDLVKDVEVHTSCSCTENCSAI